MMDSRKVIVPLHVKSTTPPPVLAIEMALTSAGKSHVVTVAFPAWAEKKVLAKMSKTRHSLMMGMAEIWHLRISDNDHYMPKIRSEYQFFGGNRVIVGNMMGYGRRK